MSRTVKYLLTILLIIAAAMWLLTVYRSCKAKENTTQTTNNLDASDNTSGSDTSLDDLYEDEDDGTTGETSGDAGATDNNGDTSTSADGGDETTDEDEEGTPSEFEDDTDVSVAGDGINRNGGEYLVVAGAFVSKSNAKRYQKQLARRNYDSEIKAFFGSDYHSVIIGEYASRSEASSIAKKIGGEAYVHKKRYPKKRR